MKNIILWSLDFTLAQMDSFFTIWVPIEQLPGEHSLIVNGSKTVRTELKGSHLYISIWKSAFFR